MTLRIGFDLDGVLADMESALVRLAEQLFRSDVARHTGDALQARTPHMSSLVPEDSADNAPIQHRLQLTDRQRSDLWRHVLMTVNFWESLEEIEPGIVARLGMMAQERRWEIIFLTRRPATAGATSQFQSQRWLEAKGFRLPSVYVVNGTRGVIAAALALDILVDDTPENCLDVAIDSKTRVIGVFRHPDVPVHPALNRLGVRVVRSTEECLNVLCELESALGREEPGALERLMRTLGLRQEAKV